MNTPFHDYRTRTLVWLLVAILIAGLVIGFVVDLGRTRTALLQAKAMQTQHLVEAAHTVVEHYYALQKTGKLSESVAKTSALNAIRALRYANAEYFWINDLGTPHPRMVMHPTLPSLDGTVLDDPVFNSATHLRYGNDDEFQTIDKPLNLFVAFNKATSRNGYGFVRYQWPKPLNDGTASKQRYPKLSFGKQFAPWGWMIGSGIYIDDIDQAILLEAQKKTAYNLLIAALLVVISFLVTQGIGRIESQQRQSRKRMQALIDATSESVLLLDEQGNVLMINHFGAQRFHTTPDQLVGKNFFDMIPKSLAQTRRLAVEEALATGEPVTTMDERAGIHFENNIYPVRSLDNDPDCVAVYAKDITDRYRQRLVEEVFRHLDSMLLKWQIHPKTLAQLFCNDILPVFHLSAAWIGKIEANGQLKLVAHSEVEDIQFLGNLETTIDFDTWPPVHSVLNQGYRQIMRRPEDASHGHEVAAKQNGITSSLVLPLHLKNQAWGVLVLYHSNHRILEENQRRLSTLATRLSLSLETAHQQQWSSLLNTAVINSNIPVLFADEEMSILWLNPALANLLGKDTQTLVGQHIDTVLKAETQLGSNVSSEQITASILAKDQQEITVNLRITALRNEEEGLTHTIIQLQPTELT